MISNTSINGKGRKPTVIGKPMIMLGTAMAIVSWVAEADIHAYVFKQGPFSQWLYPAANTNEIWMRLVIATLFLGFGFAAQRALEYKRQEEKKLKESETQYRALFESSTDAIMLLDQKKFFDCNKATLKTFGCKSQEDFLKKHLAELSPPTQPNGEASPKLPDQYIATAFDKGSVKFEWIHNRLDGTEFPADVWLTSIKLGNNCFLQATVRDISDHKQAALALAESELKFRTLAEFTTVGIFLFRDRFLYANQKCSEMSGYFLEELFQMGLADLLHPDSLSEVQQNWEKRKQGDASPKYCDVQFLTKSGEVRWGQLSTAMIIFEGLPTSIGSVVDITNRKWANKQLNEQRMSLQTILDHAPVGIWLLGRDHRIKFINPAFCNAVGIEERLFLEIVHYSELLPDDISRSCIASDKACFDTRTQTSSIEEIPCVDGKLHSFEIIKVPIFDDQSIMQGLVGLATDITEYKRVGEELQEANARVTSLIDNLQGGVLFEDQSGRMSYLNQAFCDMFSIPVPKEAIMGMDCAQISEQAKHLFTDPEAFLASLKKAEDKQRLIIGKEIAMVDGRTFEYDYIPIFHAKKFYGHLWHYRDITSFKKREESIVRLGEENSRLAQQTIIAGEKERQRLARELHDELGQNLTMIKTELGRAASRTRNSKELAKIIKTINATTDQVITSTRGMLQWLRPAAIGSLGLQAALAGLAKNWEDKQGVPCTFDSSDDLGDLNEAIQLALFRILQESLTNIAKHADARQVQVHCHKRKPSKDGDKQCGTVTLIIADDGVGLPVERKSHQGLGLIGMRGRTRAIGGKFDIESTPKKGTRIVVTFPLERESSS